MRIRRATTEEIDVLRDIERDAGERFRDLGLVSIADDEPPAAADLQAAIDDGRLWVAVLDERIVGYVWVSTVDGAGHVEQLSVRVDAGRRGAGRALMARAHEWSRERGADHVSLTTFRDVSFNGPFYEALGYRFLDDAELSPELAAIRAHERAIGLDVAPRAAMRLDLT